MIAFRGWIPTITGQLSFNVFDSTPQARNGRLATGKKVVARGRLKDDTIVHVHQALWTADYPFVPPRWAIRLHERFGDPDEHAINVAVLLAERPVGSEARTQLPMRGELFSVRPENLPRICQPELCQRASYDEISAPLNEAADMRVCFTLYRNGIVDLQNLRAKLESPDPSKVSAWELNAANRLYYLLKDFLHVHQHHADDADQTVKLKVGPAGSRDFDWAKDTLYDMYRSIIAEKRRFYEQSLTRRDMAISSSDLLGVLAYARTFEKVVRGEWKDQNGSVVECPLPEFASDELAGSLAAARDSEKLAHDWGYSDRINTLVFVLGFLSVAMAVMQVLASLKPDGVKLEMSGWALWLLESSSKEFFLAMSVPFSIVCLVLMVWWIRRRVSSVSVEWFGEYIFGLVRIAFGMSRGRAVRMFTLLGVGVCVVVWVAAWTLYGGLISPRS